MRCWLLAGIRHTADRYPLSASTPCCTASGVNSKTGCTRKREKEQKQAEGRSAQQQVDKHVAPKPIVTRRARDQRALAEEAAGRAAIPGDRADPHRRRVRSAHVPGAGDELAAAVNELDARIGYSRSEQHRQALERHEDAERLHVCPRV